ncbi:MAG TPA: DedA family protein [Pirellulales bacterium]|nr:DedA family protein [Pirellulales bacterium]
MMDALINDVGPYLVLGLPIVLTGMGLPVPEEVFVIGAGLASHAGTLEPWLALITCLVSAVLGDCAMYAIGYHFGHGLVREHPWFAKLLHPRRERQMETMIRKHGLKVFLTARFLVGVRSPVYVAAGVLRVSFRQFLLFDLLCASLVVSLFFGLSYGFADHIMGLWDEIRQAEKALTAIIVAAVAAVAFYFYWRHRQRVKRIRLRRLRRTLRKPNEAAGSQERSAADEAA